MRVALYTNKGFIFPDENGMGHLKIHSIFTDPVIPVQHKKKKFWYLVQGRQTFYDDENYLRHWKTKEEALDWAFEHLEPWRAKLIQIDG